MNHYHSRWGDISLIIPMSSVTVFTSITVINITALWKRFEHRHASIPCLRRSRCHIRRCCSCVSPIYLNLVISSISSGQPKSCSHHPVEGAGHQPANVSRRVQGRELCMKGVSAIDGRGVISARQRRMTNPTGERVVDVKACNAADAGPCGHGHHEEEKEPRVRRGKGEEGCQSIYRACTMDEVAKRVRNAQVSKEGIYGRELRKRRAPLAPCEW
jgi:hypothetical protein